MEARKTTRILPSGDREEVLATDLEVGDRFFDETRKQEGVVVKVGDGRLEYRLPEGDLSLLDLYRG